MNTYKYMVIEVLIAPHGPTIKIIYDDITSITVAEELRSTLLTTFTGHEPQNVQVLSYKG